MKQIELIHALAAIDKHGCYVFLKRDFDKMFPEESSKAMEKSLSRMVAAGLLVRAAKGIYVNPTARSRTGWIIEDIARAMRPGCMSYVSMESILSEYGAISQIPISRITIMTTGAGGLHKTPFGSIEYTHTKRSKANILSRTMLVEGRPLRIATKQAAIQDLVRVGRNVNMINWMAVSEGD